MFKHRSLRFKLLFYFFIPILLPVATLGFVGNLESSKTIEGEANRNTAQMIEQVKTNVDFYVQNVQQTLQLIATNPETVRFLNINPTTPAGERQLTEVKVRRMPSSVTPSTRK